MEISCPPRTGVQSLPTLRDPFGRNFDYLRLAVTDRCNLRCSYCMPAEGIQLKPHDNILSFEEMHRLVSILARMGVHKVRLTGGEPMVRKGITQFIRELHTIQGVKTIHLTSNGFWSQSQLDALDSLHLSSINMSLDSLQPARFSKITRLDVFPEIWNTIQILIEKKIPLKINMVVQAGVNDDELIDFAELAHRHNLDIRFIEQMPFNGSQDKHQTISANEIYSILTQAYGPLLEETPAGSTANIYRIKGRNGSLGIIAGYSRTFCSTCNRLRITSEGQLKTCLYDGGALDLRASLRNGDTDLSIAEEIHAAIQMRSKDGFESELRANLKIKSSMASIGG